MQYDIIFEWTDKSHVTGLPGYNVWIQYIDNEVVDFLEFISSNRLYEEVEYYKSLGITPKIRG